MCYMQTQTNEKTKTKNELSVTVIDRKLLM